MPLEVLSTTASVTSHPPSTSVAASRGSRRPRGRPRGAPGCPASAGGSRVSRYQSRSAASRPTKANGRIQAAWSPRPTPNRRNGPGGPPKGIGLRSRPMFLRGSERARRRRRMRMHARQCLVDAALARSRHVGAGPAVGLSRASRLAFDAAEAVVFERQPELGVVGRAADVGPLRGGRGFDERRSRRTRRPPSPPRRAAVRARAGPAPRAHRACRRVRSAEPRDRRRGSSC